MRVRYKRNGEERIADRFNMSSIAEVLVGDDSAYIRDLEVYLPKRGEWKCLQRAFRDRDLITDIYNTYFFEPPTEEDRRRGYTL